MTPAGAHARCPQMRGLGGPSRKTGAITAAKWLARTMGAEKIQYQPRVDMVAQPRVERDRRKPLNHAWCWKGLPSLNRWLTPLRPRPGGVRVRGTAHDQIPTPRSFPDDPDAISPRDGRTL